MYIEGPIYSWIKPIGVILIHYHPATALFNMYHRGSSSFWLGTALGEITLGEGAHVRM